MAELAPWLTKPDDALPLSTPPPAPEDKEKLPVAPWLKPQAEVAPWINPPDTSGPMPGPLDAAWAGVKHSISDVGQGVDIAKGQKPSEVVPDNNPAAASFEMRDLYEPLARGLPKLAYRTGESSPTIIGGIAGGLAGSAVAPGLGTAVGGAGGAAAGAALQTIGPAFAQELKRHPEDPDGAWDRAVQSTLVSGVAGGASWAAFPLKAFSGPIKNLAFQTFGIQPGINVAAQAGKNVISGDPATQGLGEAYKEGAIGTAVPAIGHLALKEKIFGMGAGRDPVSEAPTPAQSVVAANELTNKSIQKFNDSMTAPTPDIARKLVTQAGDYHEAAAYELDRHQAPARMAAKQQQADQLDQQSQNPALSPVDAQDLRNQARELRRSADHDGFIASLPPPLPQKPGRIKQFWLDNFQPELTSEAALKSDAVIARYKSMKAQIEDSLIRHGTETYRYKWNAVPWDDQKRFINAYEENLGVPQGLAARFPWMDQAYDKYRQQFEMDYKNEAIMGSRAHWLENYFPHQWDNVDKARQVFSPDNMIRSMGDKWFQKARDYELISYGEANGLKLKYDNVQNMVTDRRLAGADLINKMDMLHKLEKIGVAVPTEQAPAHVLNPAIVGSPFHWQEITSPIGEKWRIAPDAQALWENGVVAKGLWANESMLGDGFRNWMKLKSAWVPIKLGLSLFHPVHVAHILGVGNITRALTETFGTGQQGAYRRLVALPEAMLHTLGDAIFATTPYAPHSGKSIMQSWITPKELQTPMQAADVRLVNEAGISAQLSEQLRMKGVEGFKTALSKSQYLKSIPYGALAGYEKTIGALFDKWIPSLKMAALKREAELLLRRRPDLVSDDVNRRVAMRALGKSIDNRFGEMFYGSLFWNRTIKDGAIGSFLSLGWNLGFARDFGGGFFEPIVRRMIDAPNPTRQLIRQTTSKTTNMFIYAITAATINAMMTKGMSGEDATGLDYIFPRIGGLNPDGSPRRITNAFYTREVPMAMKNIQERNGNIASGLAQMLYHKMMFAPFVEMYNNKDYSGYAIRDENSPAYKQIQQSVSHLIGDQLHPMSVSGAKRALELSGKPHTTADVFQQLNDRDVYMPLLGFGPAPAYASKSALSNRLQYLFKETVAPERKSFDVTARSKERSDARTAYLGAKQNGNQEEAMAAAMKLRNLGVATKEISKLQPGGSDLYMFGRLQALDQIALMKTMTPEEFRTYFPKANKKVAQRDPAMLALWQKYNAPQQGWGPAQP